MQAEELHKSLHTTCQLRPPFETVPLLHKAITNLLDYCYRHNWAGYDPYDGLNSEVFRSIPLIQNRIGKLIFTQAMKLSPINFRPFMRVPRAQNPKALALFCTSLLILSKIGLSKSDDVIFCLFKRLHELKSPDWPCHCWGYHFDWQARDGFVPQFVPNIICTTFAGNALLDAYERFGISTYLDRAISAGVFILNGLNRTKADEGICFSYTPFDWSRVHNANLLGASYLSRLFSLTRDEKYLKPAESVVSFSIHRQNRDGSWPYGEDKTQQWIDNFHTGYNLVALKRFSESTGNADVLENLEKGYKFYRSHFFTDKGIPKYYHARCYPIDIHAIAYSIITLVEFRNYDSGNVDLARHIFMWAVNEMQSSEGFFYYQQKRFFKNRISYMRWSQAWMLLALSMVLEQLEQSQPNN